MKIIQPKTEFWNEPKDWMEQVARAARICYGKDDGKREAADMCNFLMSKGHKSMFRHGSAYFFVETIGGDRMVNWLYSILVASPFVYILYQKKRIDKVVHHRYFISTNRHYLMDNKLVAGQLAEHELSQLSFIGKVVECNFPKAYQLIRYTVCTTTQISTSRELNRTSPNNIAEQSTRFVNFGKRGGITICQPHWYEGANWWRRTLARVGWTVCEWVYNAMLRAGMKAEDARGSLPLDTATRVVYTYNVYEWRHIMALRLTGETGRPHPNAKITAQQIHDVLVPAMRVLACNDKVELVKTERPTDKA